MAKRAKVNSGFLTKADIISADDLISEVVDVPEWGGKVNVNSLTASERDEFEATMILKKEDGTTEQNLENFRAKLCAITMRNKNGKQIFKMSEATELGKKSAKAMDRVFAVAQRLNGMSAKDVEELTKN